MQVIVTTYHSPTHTRSESYSAKSTSGLRVKIWSEFGVDAEGMHNKARLALMKKLGWTGPMVGGQLSNDSMVWVFVSKRAR